MGREEITWKALICGQSSTKEITWRDEGGVARLEKHTLFTFLCKYIWVAGEAHTKVVLQLIFVLFLYVCLISKTWIISACFVACS